ncbi:MAG: lipid-A-disaccharide synthase [Deltaproteobacteria bacterium]|nr:MAG: lipid-A-disaccharide synthase [Deltaproteobacteria bacterium]
MPKKTVFIIAGEASGDLHGSNLVKAVKRLNPDIDFIGIGGDRMKQAGVKFITHSSEMAVVGFTEVLTKLKSIIKAGVKTKKILRQKRPDLVILIDYPDFNLHIAGYAKKIGIPVMYYISPQVWAWRRGRVKKIKKRVDKMVVILPFEKDFYEERGIKVSYVGHPIMDAIPKSIDRDSLRKELKISDSYPTVALLPGSRKHEIEKALPIMTKALYRLKDVYNKLKAFVILADSVSSEYAKRLIEGCEFIEIFPSKDIYRILAISDLAFVTSGTATLETAIMGVPMIVVYKGSPLSFWIAKKLVKVRYVSLVNLIANEKVVPELLQDEFNTENLIKEAVKILEDSVLNQRIRKKLKEIRNRLGEGGASEKAARIAIEMLEENYGQHSVSSR